MVTVGIPVVHIELLIACIAGSCSVVRVLCRIACKSYNEASICRVITCYIVHLTLSPALEVSVGVLCSCESTELHCCVKTSTAPLVHKEVVAA